MMKQSDWQPLAETLLGPAELTTRDVARQSGVEPDELRRLWQALGFPPVTDDERRFTRADVAVASAVRTLVETHGAHPADVLQLARAVGHAMAMVGDAQITVVAERLHERSEATAHGSGTKAVVRRLEALAPVLEPLLGYVWRRHLAAAAMQLAAAPSAADRVLIVGFADMVGFTALTQAFDTSDLAAMVDRFEAIAHGVIVEHGGRVVKMIGDEVMFCLDDPVGAARIALALAQAHTRHPDLPEVRVGVASGPTLAWQEDLFGPTVNLASRLVNLARPGTVLVSDELGERLEAQADLTLRRLRPVKLKGIGRVRSRVLRFSNPEGSSQ